MAGRAVQVKRTKVVEQEKPAPPLDVRLKKMWRNNKFACVALLVLFVSWCAVMVFSRNNYIKSWAYSKGLTYDASYNYKLAKGFLYFDPVSRGQKSYAFNVMKGHIAYTNKTSSTEEKAFVKAFDFCYTEVKTIQQNKRISRMEKTLEFSAMVFDAAGYTFKPMIVTPREMQVESDYSDLPTAQVDPDVENLLKEGGKTKKDKEKEKDAKEDKNVTANETNTTDTETPQAAVAVENLTEANNTNSSEPQLLQNETGTKLSFDFNETFKVEAADHTQADTMLPAALKKFLLDHPQFFIDFQEDQFMIYREYTMEPFEYTDALELGSKILEHLPKVLPVAPKDTSNKTESDTESDVDYSIFVSRTEL